MNPVCAQGAAFPDELVYDGERLQEVEILESYLLCGQMYVGSLAQQMLAVLGSAQCLVQFGAAQSASYHDEAELVSQGL